ncbi:hypothetical protein A4_228 [Escherichia phage A4]|nr:hypothetical protein A4_228 [Escherichia phage A4]
MINLFSTEVMIKITLVYICLFVYYHALIGILWFFKKGRILEKLYPDYMILYTIVQGVGIVLGILVHLIYLFEPHLPCITQYIVFGTTIMWLVMMGVYGLYLYRKRIVGDF